MADHDVRELFGSEGRSEVTFAAVVVTFAAELAAGQVGLRVNTLRDEEHMLAFKDGTEGLDGFNLSLDVPTATKLRDQIDGVLQDLARKAALKN